MSSIWLVVIGGMLFFLGYRYYSKYIAEKIYRLDANYLTPAHQFDDGIDYVPTNKYILWGHHFTSIAGAAPIVGPAIAVFWGWLPAFLWVVLGTVFAAGVHDFGTLVISVRHKGYSIGTLANRLIGRRAKTLFLSIILILVLMVNAVFAWVISKLFIEFPASVLTVFMEIPLAIWIGYTFIRKKRKMFIPSVIALVIMYFIAILSSYNPVLQIDLIKYLGGADKIVLFGLNGVSTAFLIWILVLMGYVYIASTLPVWKLVQPRDYINSHQLIVGLLILYLGLLITNPKITAPVTNVDSDVSWFPLLFITIACGAISGFHGLVSSGTSSKQINKETDARFIGYLGSIGEGVLALISIIAVATFFGNENEFLNTYSSFSAASRKGLDSFIRGAGQLGNGLFIPVEVARTIVAVIVVSFAATTLDTSIRLMRYIISELGSDYQLNILKKRHIATSIAVGASAALVLLPQGPQGFGSGGFLLWPLFGTSNQLLAGISLLLITIWLKKQNRNYLLTLIPMIFLLFISFWAMINQVVFGWSGLVVADQNLLLFFLGSIILCFSLWILWEAYSSLTNRVIFEDKYPSS